MDERNAARSRLASAKDYFSSSDLLSTKKIRLSKGMGGIKDQPTEAQTIGRVQCFEFVVAGMPDAKEAS